MQTDKQQHSQPSPKQREFFEIIETLGYWERTVNAATLQSVFGLQWRMAVKHLSSYRKMHPEAFYYDRSAKIFLTNDNFEPHYISTDWELYHTHLVRYTSVYNQNLFHIGSVEVIPMTYNSVTPDTMSTVVRAIKTRRVVDVKYHSMSKPRGALYSIHPHALAFNGRRWHIRAFSDDHAEFRDFNLSRISQIEITGVSTLFSINDTNWHNMASIKIAPHPKLERDQKKLVLKDYGYERTFSVPIREALVQYFIQYHHLAISEKDNPYEKPLIVKNIDQLRQHLFDSHM